MPSTDAIAALVAFETTVILDHNPSIPAANAAHLAVDTVAGSLHMSRDTVALCVLMKRHG